MELQDLLARALPEDLPLAPVEPLLHRGRRARRVRRCVHAALASILAVAVVGALALTTTWASGRQPGPAAPPSQISCPSVTAPARDDRVAGATSCPPEKARPATSGHEKGPGTP
jgi:hypothetical protein